MKVIPGLISFGDCPLVSRFLLLFFWSVFSLQERFVELVRAFLKTTALWLALEEQDRKCGASARDGQMSTLKVDSMTISTTCLMRGLRNERRKIVDRFVGLVPKVRKRVEEIDNASHAFHPRVLAVM